MASEEQKDLKKDLLKKEKIDLVKILKSKGQPTNGGKADLVDRILAYDEKNGGKMARKASSAAAKSAEDGENTGAYDYPDEEEAEEEEEAEPEPKKKPKPKPKPKAKSPSGGTSSGGGGGGGGVGGGFNPSCNCGPGLLGVAQICTLLAALGQFILGILQFILLAEALDGICDTSADVPGYSCVGESLFWENLADDDTSSALNAHWRQIFSFRPTFFFANWTPILFGFIAIMQLFSSTQWYFVSGTWVRCMFFHLFLILFAAFGYCGKAGIIIGFVEALAGFMCMLMAWFDRGGGATYMTFSY